MDIDMVATVVLVGWAWVATVAAAAYRAEWRAERGRVRRMRRALDTLPEDGDGKGEYTWW